MNLKSLDKKLLMRMGIVIGSILVLFIVFFIFALIKGNKLDYNDIESRMITSAKNYYKDNSDLLPQVNNGVVSVSTETLVEKGYLKSLEQLVKDEDAKCSGEVSVTKNDDYFLYSATLDCGDYYKTSKLKDVIINENLTTSGNGLYAYNGRYIFRGDNVNNYLSFAGKTWRIIGVNNDGTIRIIDTTKKDKIVWDDRYNSDRKENAGINDYRVSRLKDSLEAEYNLFSDAEKSYMTKQNLCIGKRNSKQTNNDGSIECSDYIADQTIGLLQLNEYPLASLDSKCILPTDKNCTNYNYMTVLVSSWTLTASAENTHKVYKISGSPFATSASSEAQLNIVININANVNYASGDGTSNNPYKFK